MRRRRTVLIGFGAVATGLADDSAMARWFPKATHLQCLSGNPRFELVGIADPSDDARDRARDAAPGARVVAVAADLADLEPEIAVLAIAPERRSAVLAALPSVRGVLVEKPLGDAECRERFVELCRSRSLAVQVHYWRRGDPALRALAKPESLAGIGSAQTAFGLYGNGLRNNGSHLIDMIRMLLRRVIAVRATTPFTADRLLPLEDDGHAAFVLDLASGAQAAVQPLDFGHYREVSLDIWGTRGRLAIQQEGLWMARFPMGDNRGLSGEREVASDRPEPIKIGVAAASPALYDNLDRALSGGAELASPLSSALATEQVLDAVIASANAGGTRIAVPEPE